MKSFEVPMFLMSLLGFCSLSSLDVPPAYADFTFGEPVHGHARLWAGELHRMFLLLMGWRSMSRECGAEGKVTTTCGY